MRLSYLMAGTLIAAIYALPAAALTLRVPPTPPDYPLPPIACDHLAGPVEGERMPCLPPGIDPRVVDGPAIPERPWVTRCRRDIVMPPPHYWHVSPVNK